METERLGPREFTQRVAINPPSQIFLSNSAITVPIKCNFPSESCGKASGRSLICILDRCDSVSRMKSASRHHCGESNQACVIRIGK